MSSLLHQHIVKIVREEKERNIDEFNEALEFVRRVGTDEEGNKVYGQATIQGQTSLTAGGSVENPNLENAKKLPGEMAEVEPPDGEIVPVTDEPEKREVKSAAKSKGREHAKRRSNGK